MAATGITSISIADHLGNTPAQSDRATGEVWLNSAMIKKLPPEYWSLYIDHEEAHIRQQTHDENKADEYAFVCFANRYPGKVHMAVDAMRAVLNVSDPEHAARLQRQQQRANRFASTRPGMPIPSRISNFNGICGPSCQAEKSRNMAQLLLGSKNMDTAVAINSSNNFFDYLTAGKNATLAQMELEYQYALEQERMKTAATTALPFGLSSKAVSVILIAGVALLIVFTLTRSS